MSTEKKIGLFFSPKSLKLLFSFLIASVKIFGMMLNKNGGKGTSLSCCWS